MRGLPKSAQQPANVYGVPGKVLQIDGDKEYLKICLDVYSQLGIPAVGVAIPETNQYKEVKNLLELKDRSKSPETAPSKGLFL